MKFVKTTTVLLSLIALLTGAMDVIVGVAGQANIGVGAAAAAPFDPVLDSQVRFLGAVWLGLGAIQLVCLGDLRRYGAILQLCFAIIALGGSAGAFAVAGRPACQRHGACIHCRRSGHRACAGAAGLGDISQSGAC